jgi:hypothetical protein
MAGYINGTIPSVGMGATVALYSDRWAVTIIEVGYWKSGPRANTIRFVRVQRDEARRTDKNGMSDHQQYTYERNPNGQTMRFALKDGIFRNPSGVLVVGSRSEYYDYSF